MRTEELTDFGLGIRVHDFDPKSDAADQMAEPQRLLYQHALLLIRARRSQRRSVVQPYMRAQRRHGGADERHRASASTADPVRS